MNYGRSKAPLALMEQIIMILVFALASAVCLQAFVYSNRVSEDGALKESAMTKAQTVAEYCKAEHGDLDAVWKRVGGEKGEDRITIHYPEEGLWLKMWVRETTEFIVRAQITVTNENEGEVYVLPFAWQRRKT